MEMEEDCLDNRLWKWKGVWATVYGNGRGLFGQPFMETEKDCFGNHLWKWKGVWATVYGNGKVFGNHLWKWKRTV
jgi:hypothetical protein